jgi:hypothetical protein
MLHYIREVTVMMWINWPVPLILWHCDSDQRHSEEKPSKASGADRCQLLAGITIEVSDFPLADSYF